MQRNEVLDLRLECQPDHTTHRWANAAANPSSNCGSESRTHAASYPEPDLGPDSDNLRAHPAINLGPEHSRTHPGTHRSPIHPRAHPKSNCGPDHLRAHHGTNPGTNPVANTIADPGADLPRSGYIGTDCSYDGLAQPAITCGCTDNSTNVCPCTAHSATNSGAD